MNTLSLNDLQYHYSLFKHVFFWLLECWDSQNEEVDHIIGTLLAEMHQLDQMFYHWSWYVFPRVLDFYQQPSSKLRFLFKYAVSLNQVDHSWNNLPDHPAKISLGRRPRPVLHLLYRTASYHQYDHKVWEELISRLKMRDSKEPQYYS